MDLSVSPYTVIPRPTMMGKKANKDIANQWIRWRSLTRQTRDIFTKLVNKRRNYGEDSPEFKSYLGTLKLSRDYAQKTVRDDFNLGKSVGALAIQEAIRRFLEKNDLGCLSSIDDDGYLPWELDIT